METCLFPPSGDQVLVLGVTGLAHRNFVVVLVLLWTSEDSTFFVSICRRVQFLLLVSYFVHKIMNTF